MINIAILDKTICRGLFLNKKMLIKASAIDPMTRLNNTVWSNELKSPSLNIPCSLTEEDSSLANSNTGKNKNDIHAAAKNRYIDCIL